MNSSHQEYYTDNNSYATMLEGQSKDSFTKYVSTITDYSNKKHAILDVGCGTGIVLELLKEKGYSAQGVDVSNNFIELAQGKGLQAQKYDGKELPFASGSFDLVGSFDVLEHTEDPILFLQEKLRVLKKGGFLLVGCPNFLSITNNYHHHTAGYIQKMKNIVSILQKITTSTTHFDTMQTIEREEFRPDDDACIVTNPIDIISWAKQNKLQTVIRSGQCHDNTKADFLDFYPCNIFLGSCFLLFRK